LSGRRKSAAQGWIGVGGLIVATVVAALLLVLVLRLVSGALRLSGAGGTGTHDPQFAEPAEAVTRPPEMEGEDGMAEMPEDPSAGWVETELTPVDKTAEELGREEAAED
jgi:hypothetical protein